MKKYSCILFDLDGTLTYSHPGIYNCIRYALSALGRAEPDEKSLRLCVGPPLSFSFGEIFGLPEEEIPIAVAKYRERYAETGLFENEPIPGAKETLSALFSAGYRQAIATSKPRVFAEKIVEKFGFSPYLEAVAGSGTDGSLPAKADVIGEAIRLLGAKKRDCLMVGDRKHDAQGARACGVDFAGLDVGYAEPGELEAESPDYLFRSFGELSDVLL